MGVPQAIPCSPSSAWHIPTCPTPLLTNQDTNTCVNRPTRTQTDPNCHGTLKCICAICNCGQHHCPMHPAKRRVAFAGESEAQAEFGAKPIPPRRQRAKEVYVASGAAFEGVTEASARFVQHKVPPRFQRKPEAYVPNKAAFQGETEATAQYQAKESARVEKVTMADNLHVAGGRFGGVSTAAADYKPARNYQRPKSYRPADKRVTGGAFHGTTESQAQFVQKQLTARIVKRTEKYRPSSAPLEGITEAAAAFQGATARPATSARPARATGVTGNHTTAALVRLCAQKVALLTVICHGLCWTLIRPQV